MSYLVLARKWRPKFFSEVSGQDHVVKALQNSLKQNKAHHAFLFAGTRGVGKTTIARLLAKALNCEQGVVAEPCGECKSCLAIDEGHFMDLIEVDAASQRGIDDTRDLLENTQYTPSSGRYKVYLIDEVHQLTKEAFNALLKTLEEPPPHMKFLLATTESEKIPITVLSRCLKFNLKKISEENISKRMTEICKEEGIEFEDKAIDMISQAADGSMRDGLSLLDQALAFEDYNLTADQVSTMLGTIDVNFALNILSSVLTQDKNSLIEALDAVDQLYPDYSDLLDTIASLTQSIAFHQVIGSSEKTNSNDNNPLIENFAETYSPELIQLIYQMAITSKRDINIAPTTKEGFTMAILRMFAFQPSESTSMNSPIKSTDNQPNINTSTTAVKSNTKETNEKEINGKMLNPKQWTADVSRMNLTGTVKQLVSHCMFGDLKDQTLKLYIDPENEHHLINRAVVTLNEYLLNYYANISKVNIQVLKTNGATLAKKKSEATEEQKIMNQSRIKSDPNLQEYMDMFDATIEDG
jgi:DNA polymerase-3 subunit gamma/tau